jgi:hypothetical protein
MRALLFLPLLLSIGCNALYDEPAFPVAAEDIELPPSAEPSAATAPRAALDDVPPPAPRLRRTKTLGVSEGPDLVGAERTAAAAAPGQAPGTTVIIHNNITQTTSTPAVYGYGYGGYGYNGTHGRGTSPGVGSPALPGENRPGGGTGNSPGRGGNSAPPVGGDWPRVPSYGPRLGRPADLGAGRRGAAPSPHTGCGGSEGNDACIGDAGDQAYTVRLSLAAGPHPRCTWRYPRNPRTACGGWGPT